MLRIDTSQLNRDESRLFLDYLGAAIREGDRHPTGSAGFERDGTFVVEIDSTLSTDDQELPVTWVVRRETDGRIPYVGVKRRDGTDLTSKWENRAKNYIASVLDSTLVQETESFFHRTCFSYIGPRLDGEYWFGETRLGPYPPEESGGGIWGQNEQTVIVDQAVEGIDRSNSGRVAFKRAQRHAARASLLLGMGLFRPLPEFRWVRPLGEEGDRSPKRGLLGNLPPVNERETMPARGEEEEIGEYSGTILEPLRIEGPTLCFPNESSLIIQRLGSAPANIEEGFDRCAKLYQVGLVIGRHFPSSGLAYAVAAVDALAGAVEDDGKFKNFVRRHVELDSAGNELVNRLWHRLRSAHFHGGQFPLGDYEGRSLKLTDCERFETRQNYSRSHQLLRTAIMSWAFQTLVQVDKGG